MVHLGRVREVGASVRAGGPLLVLPRRPLRRHRLHAGRDGHRRRRRDSRVLRGRHVDTAGRWGLQAVGQRNPVRDEILFRGDDNRAGRGRDEASSALNRYGLVEAAEQTFESLSGGQQARLQILLLELSGATMLLLDEPTDNLDLVSAEALQDALERFEGTVLAVTHDRWFARSFDRFVVFGSDGRVYESDDPVWDEGRVVRAR